MVRHSGSGLHRGAHRVGSGAHRDVHRVGVEPTPHSLADGGVGPPRIRCAHAMSTMYGIARTVRAPTMSCTPGRRTGAHRGAPPPRPPHHRCAHGDDGARTGRPGCAHHIIGARTVRTACPSRYAPLGCHPEARAPEPPSRRFRVTCHTVRHSITRIWDFGGTEVKGVCDMGTSLDPAPAAKSSRAAQKRAARRDAHHGTGQCAHPPRGRADGARTIRTGPRTNAPTARTTGAHHRIAMRTAGPGVDATVRSGPHPMSATASDVRTMHCIRCATSRWECPASPRECTTSWWGVHSIRCTPARSGRVHRSLTGFATCDIPPEQDSARGGEKSPSPGAVPAFARLRRPRPPTTGERRHGRRTGTGSPRRPPACTRSGTPPRCRRPLPRRPSSTTA